MIGGTLMITLNIKKPLDKLGKSKYWLSRETGISQNHISKMYNGLTERIYLNTLDKLCNALDCEISDILERDEK